MEQQAIQSLKLLLESDVLDSTINVMMRLWEALKGISRCNGTLQELLLRLYSESIREALHKGELHITNGIIAEKNRILKNSGIKVPDDHGLIDVNKYKGYHW